MLAGGGVETGSPGSVPWAAFLWAAQSRTGYEILPARHYTELMGHQGVESAGEFGLRAGGTPRGHLNIRFPGQYYDAETGLHYNRFRYYDPEVGRYVSADPIGQLGGVNVFSYARNSPLSLIDPFGLRVIYRDAEVSDPRTRDELEQTDASFPDHDLVVTRGDRYRDDTGIPRETLDNTPVPNSAPDSSHFGGTGVDVHLEGPAPLPATIDLEQALRDAGFDGFVSSKYPDGHTHADYRDPATCSEIDMRPVCQPPSPTSYEEP